MVDDESGLDDLSAPSDGAGSDRFERRELLGSGGMGDVHLVFDRLMKRLVAVKSLRLDDDTPEDRRRHFVQEVHLTARLEHPNIVPAYDLEPGTESGPPQLVMRFVDGEPYSTLIERLHAEPSDEGFYAALQVFLKVCDAVAFAHDQGIIHCDLKPENVMVGKRGRVYVMDWGAALRGEHEPDRPMFGSLGYMAPEQLTGDRSAVNATTDVYGLGGILCALVTGEPPRRGVGDVTDWHTTPNVEDRMGPMEVPPELCRIAERALGPSQDERYQAVDELKSEMEAFMAGGGWFETLRYLAGDVIVREGDEGSDAFIIADGFCEVFKGYDDRSRRSVRRMGPGDAFGEIALLTRKPRTATVVAQTDVQLRVITPDALKRELQRNPVLGSFVSAVTTRFADLDARLNGPDE